MGVVLLAAGVHGGLVAAVTPEQHAATIREALRPPKPTGRTEWDVIDNEADAALDALVALADERGRELDELNSMMYHCRGLLEAAEERASQHERDEAVSRADRYANEFQEHLADDRQARREADQLRAALERIADATELTGDGPLEPILADPTGCGERELKARIGIARAALAGVQAKEGT